MAMPPAPAAERSARRSGCRSGSRPAPPPADAGGFRGRSPSSSNAGSAPSPADPRPGESARRSWDSRRTRSWRLASHGCGSVVPRKPGNVVRHDSIVRLAHQGGRDQEIRRGTVAGGRDVVQHGDAQQGLDVRVVRQRLERVPEEDQEVDARLRRCATRSAGRRPADRGSDARPADRAPRRCAPRSSRWRTDRARPATRGCSGPTRAGPSCDCRGPPAPPACAPSSVSPCPSSFHPCRQPWRPL